MKNLKRFVLCLAAALYLAAPAKAYNKSYDSDKVFISAEMKRTGSELDVLFSFTLKDGWHILYQNPGDIGTPTTFKFSNAKADLLQTRLSADDFTSLKDFAKNWVENNL